MANPNALTLELPASNMLYLVLGNYTKSTLQKTFIIKDVTKVTNPQAGIKPAPSHQAGVRAAGFCLHLNFLCKANIQMWELILPFLQLWGLPGPQKLRPSLGGGWLSLSRPILAAQGTQFKPSLHLECLSSQSQNGNKIGKDLMIPVAKPARTNDQSGQDGPPKSQTTVPENPKNDHEADNQTEEPEMPSLATQIAPEECPEAHACE
ncbi:hypothetical protein DSO57_1015379 [Entomophthora muscae]|uniref:Uncharacterized protein n=1 Tax=Entomophthora muscae TaxID=34485 RepID=A0ACC2RWC9_9FUNG|nr:hypothetical protein DSO57_1015379 [Entomophthora muscae]